MPSETKRERALRLARAAGFSIYEGEVFSPIFSTSGLIGLVSLARAEAFVEAAQCRGIHGDQVREAIRTLIYQEERDAK